MPQKREPIQLDPSRTRDELLLTLQGFDPNKSGEFRVLLDWILRDPDLQPRVRGQNPEQVETITASLASQNGNGAEEAEKEGEEPELDTPIPCCLNPDPDSEQPFKNFGGNHRIDGLLRLNAEYCTIRYNHRVTPENAARIAFRDNTTLPMSLRDELVFVAREMAVELKKLPPGDYQTRIRAAAAKLVPHANKGIAWIIGRYIMSTLHPDVQKMMFTKSHDKEFISKGDGQLLAQIPNKEIQLATAKAMQGQSNMRKAQILAQAIEDHAPSGADQVSSNRLCVGDAALLAAADVAGADMATHAPNGSARTGKPPTGVANLPDHGRSRHRRDAPQTQHQSTPTKPTDPLDVFTKVMESSRKLISRAEEVTRSNPAVFKSVSGEQAGKCVEGLKKLREKLQRIEDFFSEKMTATQN